MTILEIRNEYNNTVRSFKINIDRISLSLRVEHALERKGNLIIDINNGKEYLPYEFYSKYSLVIKDK